MLQLGDTISKEKGENIIVRDILKSKNSPSQVASPDINRDPDPTHPIIFENVDATAIRSAPLRTTGAVGSSGIDGEGYYTSYKSASNDL